MLASDLIALITLGFWVLVGAVVVAGVVTAGVMVYDFFIRD